MHELFGYPDLSRTFNFCVMCFVFVLGFLEFSPMVFYGVGLSHGMLSLLNFIDYDEGHGCRVLEPAHAVDHVVLEIS